MKKHLTFLLLVLLISSLHCFANSDSIQLVRYSSGTKFIRNHKILSLGDVVRIMRSDELAYPAIIQARRIHGFENVMGAAGGALIGFQLGKILGGGELNVPALGTGIALVCFLYPIHQSFLKHSFLAVNIYNEGLEKSTSFKPTNLKLGFGITSIKLSYTF